MHQIKLVFTIQVWQHLNVQKTKFVASENIAEEPQAFWLFEKLAQILDPLYALWFLSPT